MIERLTALLNALSSPALPEIDLSLNRMVRLLAALGHPETQLPPVIHVAGTNGKGSTIAYLHAIYETAGYHVHTYTSPHLVRFNERIVIAGHEASDAMLVPYLERVERVSKRIPVTFFEATTAAAFLAFSGHKADVLLLETGLGGRLDATNVIAKPLATVITPIAMDHTEFLGDSLEAIATEKAGILKPNVPCITGMQAEPVFDVIAHKAQEIGAPLIGYRNDWDAVIDRDGFELTFRGALHRLPFPSLPGTHQVHNAALAVVTALVVQSSLKVTLEQITQGIGKAHWPARLQRLKHGTLVQLWHGDVMLDGGHNEAAAEALAAWITEQEKPVHLVVGMMQRKDVAAFFQPLSGAAAGVLCIEIPHHKDVHSASALAKAAKAAGCKNVVMAPSLEAGVSMLAKRMDGVLLVTGSLFLAGEILKTHE